MTTILDARFAYATDKADFTPERSLPEIVICGRSNVGKSTLINSLLGRKKLARTSSKPGSTKQFLYYQIKFRTSEGREHEMYLLDLPGYGYARFSKKQRTHLNKEIVRTFECRPQIKATFLLNDIRRDPTDDEVAVQHLCFEAEIPLFILLTKGDTIKRHQQKERRGKIAASFGLDPSDMLITGQGIPSLLVWERVVELL